MPKVNLHPNLKAIVKAVIWLAWNVISGLTPFLTVIFIATTILDGQSPQAEHSKHELNHLLNDCIILFFCCAIMGEITIEAFLGKVKFGKYSYLGFCTSFFMTLILVCILYTTVVFGQLNNKPFNNVNNMEAFQKYVVYFAALYSLFIKSILIREEEKMYDICQSISTT